MKISKESWKYSEGHESGYYAEEYESGDKSVLGERDNRYGKEHVKMVEMKGKWTHRNSGKEDKDNCEHENEPIEELYEVWTIHFNGLKGQKNERNGHGDGMTRSTTKMVHQVMMP